MIAFDEKTYLLLRSLCHASLLQKVVFVSTVSSSCGDQNNPFNDPSDQDDDNKVVVVYISAWLLSRSYIMPIVTPMFILKKVVFTNCIDTKVLVMFCEYPHPKERNLYPGYSADRNTRQLQ